MAGALRGQQDAKRIDVFPTQGPESITFIQGKWFK
jgi:hypothetical protein